MSSRNRGSAKAKASSGNKDASSSPTISGKQLKGVESPPSLKSSIIHTSIKKSTFMTSNSTTTKGNAASAFASTSKLDSPVFRFAQWVEDYQLKKAAPALAVLGAALIRWAVSLGPYSGFATPPTFGDFEAQRHWMELSMHVPIKDWYRYDETWWRLDYPPLSAYVSWICGVVGSLFSEEWFALEKSRGFESDGIKLFMRTSVLVFELVVYFTGVFVFVQRWFVNQSWARKYTALLLILLQPGLILIDHGHFQYNSVMLGLTVWAVNCFLHDQDVLGSVFFCLTLSFKQMALYYSPAVFGYLLGKSLRQGVFGCLFKLVKLGTTVIATLGIMFSPWLQSQDDILQVVSRIFPVFRGLYEDKVANFWCAINVAIKLRTMFQIQDLIRFSALATLVSFLPSLAHLILKPSKKTMVYGLANSSLSFFLLSFQVHEKSILIPALPITLLILDEPIAAPWFISAAMFSMFPLLRREGLTMPYYALLGFWVWMNATRSFKTAAKVSPLLGWIGILGHIWIVLMHAAELIVDVPARFPDLFAVLNVVVCAGVFLLFWAYFNFRQFAVLSS